LLSSKQTYKKEDLATRHKMMPKRVLPCFSVFQQLWEC